MQHSKLMAVLLTASLLSGCATPDNGYYDANGNWIPYNRYNREAHEHSPLPGGTYDSRYDRAPVTTTVTTYTYDRPGYYDYNGYYIAPGGGLNVPPEMSPPHGMCRIWFSERTADSQPPIETCEGIRSRVPMGAYVIYGG